ncbi:MAG: IS110 family transposase, partial [Hyphomicrobiales bacterium]|nr:IS110 family transposase [Hyphomicrobiales bacterium]
GRVVLRKRLTRHQLLRFFAQHPPALIGMEACGSAHHWGRELEKLGHQVKLMPASYVKPFVKRNKTDGHDAEGCCEAVKRPSMRFVRVKSIAQQCERGLQRSRDLLVRQRTQLMNAMRGLLAEMGIVAGQGLIGFAKLAAIVKDKDKAIPPELLPCLEMMLRQWQGLETETRRLEALIVKRVKQNEPMRRLMGAPGVGPLTAHATLAAVGDASQFRSARDFAAWLGLTPKQHSSGNKLRSAGISRQGDKALRRLFILGASATLRQARNRPDRASPWVNAILARRPVKVAVVAQAAKTARIVWALLVSGESYRATPRAA